MELTGDESDGKDYVIAEKWIDLRENLIQVLDSPNGQNLTKDVIRTLHQTQRKERAQFEKKVLNTYGQRVLSYFADGNEIDPPKISPELVLIDKSIPAGDSYCEHIIEVRSPEVKFNGKK